MDPTTPVRAGFGLAVGAARLGLGSARLGLGVVRLSIGAARMAAEAVLDRDGTDSAYERHEPAGAPGPPTSAHSLPGTGVRRPGRRAPTQAGTATPTGRRPGAGGAADGSAPSRSAAPARPPQRPSRPDRPERARGAVPAGGPSTRSAAARTGTAARTDLTGEAAGRLTPPNADAPQRRERDVAPRPKKPRRTAAPKKGEVSRRREATRQKAADPAGPGPELRVAAPWQGYDEMTAAVIVDRLGDADEATRAAVRLYEQANKNRVSVRRATGGE